MISDIACNSLETPGLGYVHEVFSGIQGEGLYVGERQIFVRLSGCNLACKYCDTPVSRSSSDVCRIERTAGRRDFSDVRNPISAEALVKYIVILAHPRGLHHSISITGGEPLVQSNFAACVCRLLKREGYTVFLETNGILSDALPQVLPYVDIVSMDIKLSSVTASPTLMHEHAAFLQLAQASSVYVKLILGSETDEDELMRAVEVVAASSTDIPVILQPVTERGGVFTPSPEQMLDWQAMCKSRLSSVRVIPQCHKLMGQL